MSLELYMRLVSPAREEEAWYPATASGEVCYTALQNCSCDRTSFGGRASTWYFLLYI
jgi:hypothetical protein